MAMKVLVVEDNEEHRRCGELDGGRDEGYVWLACSCGARIVHPASAPPPTPART